MPDMGHSIAYEANYYNYYYHNTWGSQDDYYEMESVTDPSGDAWMLVVLDLQERLAKLNAGSR